jgi:hypothetical protein
MGVAANPRRVTGLMLMGGAVIMLGAAGAVYAKLIPDFGLRRELLAISLVIMAAFDLVVGLVYLFRS